MAGHNVFPPRETISREKVSMEKWRGVAFGNVCDADFVVILFCDCLADSCVDVVCRDDHHYIKLRRILQFGKFHKCGVAYVANCQEWSCFIPKCPKEPNVLGWGGNTLLLCTLTSCLSRAGVHP